MKFAAILFAVFGVAFLAGCLGGQPQATPTPIVTDIPTVTATATATGVPTVTSTATPTPSPKQVSIKNSEYLPNRLTVKVGETVTWVNEDTVPHTVTADAGITGPDSPTIQPGGSFSYTFTTKGIATYHCSLHPIMKASVEVTE